ncbi:hypothetical protein N7449_000947 [Penicillium cf. viridicatum]|uniref:Uncharacterized protein n=1 Tax=Penicillium cf. viridicatum TaxID=2972119 RepID=A0A9W9N5V0_9EURO|nr:hypothetical protein N7449_000947 [Penicillium cf. viridicatum]
MTLKGYSDHITSIAWSPDGSRLASGSTEDGTVRVWEQTTRKCVSMLQVNYRGGLKFGETHSGHLHTDTGVFDLASATPIPISLGKSPALSHPVGYGININGNWITLAGENILRLPLEFEAKCMFSLASCATTTVAIACPMGRVSMLTLRNDSVL